jgi:CBS domain-containing protein
MRLPAYSNRLIRLREARSFANAGGRCYRKTARFRQWAGGGNGMNIRDILKAKGSNVFSIAPGAAVPEALALMVKNDIGSLVVLDGARMAGMLTFREVLRALAAKGNLTGLKVGDVMIKDAACGNPEDSLESLRELMNKDHIRYLPVKEGDKLLGVISFHDVANAVIKETTFHNKLLKSYIKNWPEAEEKAK